MLNHDLHITAESALADFERRAREGVNKQLNVFQRDGFIALARGAVILSDEAGLRHYL